MKKKTGTQAQRLKREQAAGCPRLLADRLPQLLMSCAIILGLAVTLSSCGAGSQYKWSGELDAAREARNKGNYPEALKLGQHVLELIQTENGPDKDLFAVYTIMADGYLAQNQFDKAADLEKRAAELAEKNKRWGDAAIHYYDAAQDTEKNNAKASAPLFVKALENKLRDTGGNANPDLLPYMMSSARAAAASGAYDDAEKYYKQALAILQAHPPDSMEVQIEANDKLAEVYRQTGRYMQALQYFDVADHMAETANSEKSRLTDIRRRFAFCLDKVGRHDEADMWLHKE